ncbi:alpha/beta hydrolase [Synechococcus sp. A10-1-5-1]|uniref:alpha/beta hydrolase n=1 Tax=Synechococcus sp. A10-1-5-1 TaxID=2936507 RepID=UPI00200160F1|nr:alpha/beta hydrolase [Synechococcus sp. A10-1-5-1]UPM51041.1 alpha/beta hydrolase [Synechococcus sp. A10-1-5-1]
MVEPTRLRRRRALSSSLLAGVLSLGSLLALPLRAAEQLDIHLDGLDLPLNLAELERWSRDPQARSGELTVWLNLLDPQSQQQLHRLLNVSLVQQRSFTQQMMRSWAGQRVAEELGVLLSTENGNAGPLVLSTLNTLLKDQQQVTVMELMRALPARQLTINLDGLQQLARGWRQQLSDQEAALQALQTLPLPQGTPLLPLSDGVLLERQPSPADRALQRWRLPVPHRQQPLELELWPVQGAKTWVLLMPGLGGSTDQLRWLAQALHERNWPVVLLDHPGSNELAVRELVQGRRLPPGAETLPGRVQDLQAVVAAAQAGGLPKLGQRVVLMGHSLGGLTSLLAAGLRPEPGLQRRCKRSLADLPLINLSRLLQCQLPEVALPPVQPLAQPIAGVVTFNGFGSLLFPHRGLRDLDVPVFMLGGSLDLITPPLSEQLRLFLPDPNPRSRLVLLEGASHFSPVRMQAGGEAPLFKFGEEWVGVDPTRVQNLILSLSSEFLWGLDQRGLRRDLPPQRRDLGGVSAYVLDHDLAKLWQTRIEVRTSRADPTAPPAGPPER